MRSGLIVLIALFLSGFNSAAAPVITVPTVTTGLGEFDIGITIAGVTDLYAFQFDLGFNPNVLSAISVSEGDFLLSAGSTFFVPGAIDNVNGLVSFTVDSLLTAISGASGAGIMATIRFDAIQNGLSYLTVANEVLLNSGLSIINSSTANGFVTVGSVPEPASIALVCVALLLSTKRSLPNWLKSTIKGFERS